MVDHLLAMVVATLAPMLAPQPNAQPPPAPAPLPHVGGNAAIPLQAPLTLAAPRSPLLKEDMWLTETNPQAVVPDLKSGPSPQGHPTSLVQGGAQSQGPLACRLHQPF